MASSPSLHVEEPPALAAGEQPRGWVLACALLTIATTLALHGVAVVRPMLLYDDFEILSASWTWEQTRDNLWRPANEHTMPLGRLTTWLLCQAGNVTWLPYVAALHGPLAVVLGMVLVFLFVRRELGHPGYGLIAMALFGITSQYAEAVRWFAASFAILALDTILLALLAAQRWRQTGRARHLAWAALWSALAPCWFASGILAGPLCFLYLLPGSATVTWSPGHLVTWSRRLAVASIPVLGSVLFLAVTLPRNADHIMHLEHYKMSHKTAVQAFQLDIGLAYTARSLVDNLLLGTFGIGGVNCPVGLVVPLLLMLVAGAVWWWLRAPNRRLLLVGLGLIFLSYVLTYSARSEWGYHQVSSWGRYQLLPHLGLVLFISGGLPRFEGWLLQDWPTAPQRWLALLLLARLGEVLFVTQLPRSAFTYHDSRQAADLARIRAVDARCVEHGISAAAVKDALPPLRVQGSGDRDNGWDFLRGSPAPQPLPRWEVRRILNDLAGAEPGSKP